MLRFESLVKRRLPVICAQTYLASVLVGFFACIALGHLASQSDILKASVRFGLFQNPMSSFYPPAKMVLSRVLAEVRPDRTLVLVGGNSNFNGAGQHEQDLWTRDLQASLGDKFKVINLATMGSDSTDFAGVIFRIVEPRHPNTVLVYNTYCNNLARFNLTSKDPFAYFFWDAYYKGLIPDEPEMTELYKDTRDKQIRGDLREMHLGLWLDSLTYSRDLWSYIGYRWLFTVAGSFPPADPLILPRMARAENELPYLNLRERVRQSGMTNESLLANLRGQFADSTARQPDGKLTENKSVWDNWRGLYAQNLPQRQKKKTIVALLWTNPFFVAMLKPTEQEEYAFTVSYAIEQLKMLGYHAFSLGRDYDPEDFTFSFHYVGSASPKMGADVAREIVKLGSVN